MIRKQCGITGNRYTMKADVLLQYGNADPETGGAYNTYIHPDSGEVIRVWESGTADDPDTPTVDETTIRKSVFCMARSVKSDGMRVNATTEDWGKLVMESDYVNIWYPAGGAVIITKHDRITNIRDASTGQVYWLEEEFDTPTPTVFDVIGVENKFDAFGRLVEYKVTLERAEVQQQNA